MTSFRYVVLLLSIFLPAVLFAQEPPPAHYSTFGAGPGPELSNGVYRILAADHPFDQSNTVAFDLAQPGAFERVMLRCRLRVLAGGDGGSLLFLNTTEYAQRGPAPFLKSWVEADLARTFAVGIDVHNPPNRDSYGIWGNIDGLPEREVSLHWNGREYAKRVAPVEFGGDFEDLEITVQHVIGGAEITVRLAGAVVYDRYFLAGMLPYESRLAIGAGTRADTATEFDVQDIEFLASEPALPRRTRMHSEIFNHVMINGVTPSHLKEVTLPPLDWAYGRVILNLAIHDAGPQWDTWDKSGHFYVYDADGVKHDIVPFITSYRTPCRWQVDVTSFRPWLTGKVKLEIAIDTQSGTSSGYMMSASLDFYHGVPDLEPYRILPVWNGLARYKSADNHFRDFFSPRHLSIDTQAQAAHLFITTTGHSSVGEFTPSQRAIVFVPEQGGAEQRFENVLWKTDCYLNPVRPQGGTWKFARAGWAPGDFVRPWWIDLTPFMVPGETAELRYEPQPYDFSALPEDQRPENDEVSQAIHLVRSYLVLYRSPQALTEAPNLEILNVESGSNAAQAGILVGDFLKSYADIRTDTIEDLRAAIRSAEAQGKGDIVVVIFRAGKRMEIAIDPGRMGIKVAEDLQD